MNNCIFCQIIAKKIPAKLIYEDTELIAFNDIHPRAKVHFLIIPKKHLVSLAECTEQEQNLLGKMLLLAPKLAMQQGLQHGFKTAINTGSAGGQEVWHLHLHIYGDGV